MAAKPGFCFPAVIMYFVRFCKIRFLKCTSGAKYCAIANSHKHTHKHTHTHTNAHIHTCLQWYSVDFGKNDKEKLQFISKFLQVKNHKTTLILV